MMLMMVKMMMIMMILMVKMMMETRLMSHLKASHSGLGSTGKTELALEILCGIRCYNDNVRGDTRIIQMEVNIPWLQR